MFFFLLLAAQIFVPPTNAKVFRVADGGPKARASCHQSDDSLIFSVRPRCSEWRQADGMRYLIRFNKLGLRGSDYDSTPTKGAIRVLLLGDSGMFNTGVKEESTGGNLLGGH